MVKRLWEWSNTPPKEERGVLVGVDGRLEWLLSWWWEGYSSTNSLPVAFVDFGMSKEKKQWCRERGILIEMPYYEIGAIPKEDIPPAQVRAWEEKMGGRFWGSRSAWFKKPFGCILTPFKKTLWMDVDCEVRGDISKLFLIKGLAMRIEPHEYLPGIPEYNAGVILFNWGDPLFEKWAKLSGMESDRFRGDQEVLSWLIYEQQQVIQLLEDIYNWSREKGDSPAILIYHWHGEKGKAYIAHQLWKKSLNR